MLLDGYSKNNKKRIYPTYPTSLVQELNFLNLYNQTERLNKVIDMVVYKQEENIYSYICKFTETSKRRRSWLSLFFNVCIV